MDKYEHMMLVGEGSYGVVMKCRHRDTDQVVAIKKFLETEEDATIRKMALREIRMLRKLKHENLVAIIEVFRYKKRFYLVFEYLNGTILDELERMDGGLGEERTRERLYQILRAINYCHVNQIIHRDVKPENVLVSSNGVVKLCDFGFARLTNSTNEALTDYVATRWYRAPELLVGDPNYGTGVDIWAIGCLFAEMLTGDPLFPGDSDIDQLFLIVKMMGKPCVKHQQLMSKNSALRGIKAASPQFSNSLRSNFPDWPFLSLDILANCLKMDPNQRATSEELLRHSYFVHDNFPQIFVSALREKVLMEYNANPLLRKAKAEILYSTDRHEEMKNRKHSSSSVGERAKWKFNFAAGDVKRKNETATKTREKSMGGKQYLNEFQNGNTAAEMYVLEKSLESLARLSKKNNHNHGETSPLKEVPFDIKPNTPIETNNKGVNFKKSPLNSTKTSVSFNRGSNVKKETNWTDWKARKNSKGVAVGGGPSELTLPNVPGAVSNKSKKNTTQQSDTSLNSNTVTSVSRNNYNYNNSNDKRSIMMKEFQFLPFYFSLLHFIED